MQEARSWKPDARSWMLDAGCWRWGLMIAFVAVLGACQPPPTPSSDSGIPISEIVTLTPCEGLSTVVPPTPPAVIPGYAKLDETTNLHVTGTMQEIDVEEYRLVITGTAVSQPLSLTYDDLRCMPKREVRSILTCPGFFEDEATWAGVPLDHILELASVSPDAGSIRLKGMDGYITRVEMELIRDNPRNIIAYEWEGESLPILHGFPARAVFPGQQGNKWVKWLLEIRVE